MHDFNIGSMIDRILTNKVNYVPPNTEIISRMAPGYLQVVLVYIGKNQWAIFDGPGISINDEDYKYSLEEVLNQLVTKITNFAGSSKIRFNTMLLPSNTLKEGRLEKYNNILVRSLEDYFPATDIQATRFDVLINRMVKNA